MPFEDPNVTSSTVQSEDTGAATPQPANTQAHNPPEPKKPTAGRTRNEENMTEDFATALESFEQEQAQTEAR